MTLVKVYFRYKHKLDWCFMEVHSVEVASLWLFSDNPEKVFISARVVRPLVHKKAA